jgi:[ribosomal protein S5]-alanine N-acetyltransferase
MAAPLLSAGKLRYCSLMNQKPAPLSEQQPLVILTTPRLILRAVVEEDISVLHNLIFGDSDVMRFAFSGAPMAGDAAEDFIRRFFTFGVSLTGMRF